MQAQETATTRSFVLLEGGRDEYGECRAFVRIETTEKDRDLWDVIDQAALAVAQVFAAGGPMEILLPARSDYPDRRIAVPLLRSEPSRSPTGQLRLLAASLRAASCPCKQWNGLPYPLSRVLP